LEVSCSLQGPRLRADGFSEMDQSGNYLEKMLRDFSLYTVAKEVHRIALSKEVENEKIDVQAVDVFPDTGLRTHEDVYAPLMQELTTANTFGELTEMRRQVLEKLRNLDIFKTMNIVVVPNVDKETLRSLRSDSSVPIPVIIRFYLEEKKRIGLSMKTHTTTDFQPYFQATGESRNVWGRGEKLSGSFKRSTNNDTEFEGSLHKPLLRFGYDKSVSVAAHKQNTNYESLSGFSEGSVGLSIGALSGKHGLSYDLSYRDIQVAKGSSLAILREGGESVKSAIKYRWLYDSRDDKLLPLEGSMVQVAAEVAGLGGDARHISPEIRLQKHSLIHPAGWGLHLISRLGAHVPFGGARSYISDRYFLGGPISFRGFSERGIGPRRGKDAHGGDLLFTSAVHLSYPLLQLSWGVLRSHVFCQLGNLAPYDTTRSASSNVADLLGNRRASAGIGFFLSSPLGIGANFSYVHPISAQRTDETKNFQFGFYVDFM